MTKQDLIDRAASATFDSLRTAVDQMEIGCGSGSLGDRLDDVLDRARVNADDTCYVEKSAPVEEYGRIALDSIACILSERDTDRDVIAWFAAQGVRY